MLLLKAFFRKKTVKIYLIIMCSIIICIMTLLNFINYFDFMIDEINTRNSITLVSSTVDYYQELIDTGKIKDIRRTLLLTPDKSYDTISILPERFCIAESKECNIINSNEVNVDQELLDSGVTLVTWKWFQIFNESNIVIAFPNSQIKNNNEISLGISKSFINYTDALERIIQKPIGFYHKTLSIEFIINEIHVSRWPKLLISNELYEDMIKNDEYFSYILTLKSNDDSERILSLLKKQDKTNNLTVLKSVHFQDDEDSNTLRFFESIVEIMTIVTYIVVLLFIFISINVIKNMISDNNKSLLLYQKMGYNKFKIKKTLLVQLGILIFITLVLSFIIIELLNIIINTLLGFNLVINHLNFLIICFSIFMLVVFLAVSTKINDTISE